MPPTRPRCEKDSERLPYEMILGTLRHITQMPHRSTWDVSCPEDGFPHTVFASAARDYLHDCEATLSIIWKNLLFFRTEPQSSRIFPLPKINHLHRPQNPFPTDSQRGVRLPSHLLKDLVSGAFLKNHRNDNGYTFEEVKKRTSNFKTKDHLYYST